MEPRYQKYKDLGFQQYMVIGAGAGFGDPATASYCKKVRSDYELTFPVLYDPTGKLATTYGYSGPNERNFLFSPGAVIDHIQQYTPSSTIDAKIEAILGL